MKILFQFFFLICCLINIAQAQLDRTMIDGLVGIVGNKVILLSDIEVQHEQMKLEGDLPENFRCLLLGQILSQKMLLQQALLDSIIISEDEIESELDRRINYFVGMIGSEEKLEEYYEKSIIKIKDEFRSDIEEQLLSNKMKSNILAGTKVTPSEVKSFFNEIPEDSLPYFNAEVEVGQIVIYPSIDKVQQQLAIEKLEGIRERIAQGEDFYSLALIYSEDPGSVDNGGDLGFVGRGEMVSEFEAAGFRLKEGEVSDVIKTQFGYHIIQLIERKGERFNLRHILIKPKVTSFDLTKAKGRLDSIRQKIVSDSLLFTVAATTLSDDEGTKHQGGMLMNQQTGNSAFEMDQLEQSVFFAIEKLVPGDISAPIFYQTPSGQQAYRIIYLKSETEAHQASLKEDYHKIKAAALSKKEEDTTNRWLQDKISSTYVYVEKSFGDCTNLQAWKIQQNTIEKTYE